MYIVTTMRDGTVGIWEGEKIEKIIFCEFNLGTACVEQGLRNVIGEYFNRIEDPCLED